MSTSRTSRNAYIFLNTSLYQSASLQLLQQSAKSMKIECSNKTHKQETSTSWNNSNVCKCWSASLHIYTSLYNYKSHHRITLVASTNSMSVGRTICSIHWRSCGKPGIVRVVRVKCHCVIIGAGDDIVF